MEGLVGRGRRVEDPLIIAWTDVNWSVPIERMISNSKYKAQVFSLLLLWCFASLITSDSHVYLLKHQMFPISLLCYFIKVWGKLLKPPMKEIYFKRRSLGNVLPEKIRNK